MPATAAVTRDVVVALADVVVDDETLAGSTSTSVVVVSVVAGGAVVVVSVVAGTPVVGGASVVATGSVVGGASVVDVDVVVVVGSRSAPKSHVRSAPDLGTVTVTHVSPAGRSLSRASSPAFPVVMM